MEFGVIILLKAWFSNVKIRYAGESKEAENGQTMLCHLLISRDILRQNAYNCQISALPLLPSSWLIEAEHPHYLENMCASRLINHYISSVNKISGGKREACLTSSN